MSEFIVKDNHFEFDGKPLQIISGAIHYFRTVPEYWKDRLTKLKACGFNTVETYIPWNLHEPKEGQFRFEGIADVERFIRTAADCAPVLKEGKNEIVVLEYDSVTEPVVSFEAKHDIG